MLSIRVKKCGRKSLRAKLDWGHESTSDLKAARLHLPQVLELRSKESQKLSLLKTQNPPLLLPAHPPRR